MYILFFKLNVLGPSASSMGVWATRAIERWLANFSDWCISTPFNPLSFSLNRDKVFIPYSNFPLGCCLFLARIKTQSFLSIQLSLHSVNTCVYASELHFLFCHVFLYVGRKLKFSNKNGFYAVVDWCKVVCKQLQHTWRIVTHKEAQNKPDQTKCYLYLFCCWKKSKSIDTKTPLYTCSKPNSNLDSINFIWPKGHQQSNVYSVQANSLMGEQNHDKNIHDFFPYLEKSFSPRETIVNANEHKHLVVSIIDMTTKDKWSKSLHTFLNN